MPRGWQVCRSLYSINKSAWSVHVFCTSSCLFFLGGGGEGGGGGGGGALQHPSLQKWLIRAPVAGAGPALGTTLCLLLCHAHMLSCTIFILSLHLIIMLTTMLTCFLAQCVEHSEFKNSILAVVLSAFFPASYFGPSKVSCT